MPKNILDLFIKPDESSNKEANDTKTAYETVNQPPVNNQNAVIPEAPVTMNTESIITKPIDKTETNTDIIRNIWEVLVEKNFPGPDYLEIRNSAAALESMNMSVEQRYEAAFKMLKAATPDFTKEYLLSSIDKYISFVNEELAEGMKQCAEKRNREIDGKTAQVEEMRARSQQILEEIEKKKAEYNEVLASIQNIESVLNESKFKLDREEMVFKNSINTVIETLTNDKKIMSNLNI